MPNPTTFADVTADFQLVIDGIADLATEIARLKAAGPSQVTQDQLDALDAQAKAAAQSTRDAQ